MHARECAQGNTVSCRLRAAPLKAGRVVFGHVRVTVGVGGGVPEFVTPGASDTVAFGVLEFVTPGASDTAF